MSELVPSQELPDALFLRSRVHWTTPQREFGLETVAATREGELVVGGLAAFGVRAFTVRQRGSEYEVEERASGRLAPPAMHVLDALHRIHWIGPGRDGGDAPGGASVSIDYPLEDEKGHGAIAIRNASCGYEARFVTLESRP